MSITETKANCKYVFLKNDVDKNAHKAYNARRIKSAHYERLVEMSALEMKGMGYITVSGKCPVQYFQKKFYGMQVGGESNERM